MKVPVFSAIVRLAQLVPVAELVAAVTAPGPRHPGTPPRPRPHQA